MQKLIEGKIYNINGKQWRFNGKFPGRTICDLCHKVRPSTYEFIHPSTPYGDNWDGFRKADEPLRLGTECFKKVITND